LLFHIGAGQLVFYELHGRTDCAAQLFVVDRQVKADPILIIARWIVLIATCLHAAPGASRVTAMIFVAAVLVGVHGFSAEVLGVLGLV